MKVGRIVLSPNTLDVALLARDLFGVLRVDVGTWITPISVEDVTEEEVIAARELLVEHGVTVHAPWMGDCT